MRSANAQIVAIVLLVSLVFAGTGWVRAHSYGGHASALVGFGCRAGGHCFAEDNRASLPAEAVVFRTGGYDGQFFYYLGRELYGGPRAVVDSEPFRRARIGLPLLAGPLLAAGDVGRRYGLPATLLVLHLASVWALWRARRGVLAVLAFGLNPFSLLAFMLSTADGAALSLGVLGVLALEAKGARRAGGLALLALALLTKETLLVVPAALAGARLFERELPFRARLEHAALMAGTTLPLLVWWRHVGFSFGLAAEHGGLPFSGMLSYLPSADLPRALLALIAVLSIGWGALLLRAPPTRAAGFTLWGGAALVSLATAGEYWGTFANVARLFTPIAALAVLVPLELTRGASAASPWVRRVGGAWALSLLFLTVLIVAREATRSALPYYLLSAP